MEPAFYTCCAWAPCGVAKPSFQKGKNAKDDYKKFVEAVLLTKSEVKSEKSNIENPCCSSLHDNALAKYNLDTYDEDDAFTLPGKDEDEEDTELEFDRNDEHDVYDKQSFEIEPGDNLLIFGQIYDEHGVINVYVYNHDTSDFYCHHEIYTKSPPICMEWIGCNTNGILGNFLAIGCESSNILLYNLDLETLQPHAVLGKSREQGILWEKETEDSVNDHDVLQVNWSETGHDSDVVALAWNKVLKNILASASTDNNLFIWDIFKLEVLIKITHHETVSSCLAWHPNEGQLLLCGNENEKVYLINCHAPNVPVIQWSVTGEVQTVEWNCFNPDIIVCTSDDGYMRMYYMPTKSEIYEFACQGHITGLAFCESESRKMMVTGNLDGVVNIWDVNDAASVHLIKTVDFDIGNITDIKSCPDYPSVLAFVGEVRMIVKKVSDILS